MRKKFDFLNILKNKLFPFYRTKEAKLLFSILQENGKQTSKFVGGCVRKYFSNDLIDDLDIATELPPEIVKDKIKSHNLKVYDTGIEHGTVTVIINKKKFEITTLRRDVKTFGRHAEVSFTNDWFEDSKRRDFTINSIYLDHKGNVFDPHNGMTDLKNKKIRFIGNIDQRIEEDYLRILRYLRFLIYYNSEIEKYNIKKIKLNLNNLQKISRERIYDELSKIIKINNFKKISKNADLLEIFNLMFPELKYTSRLTKEFEYSIDQDLILSIILLDESMEFEYFCYKYKVSNKFKHKLKLFHMSLLESKKNKNFFNKDLSKNIYLKGKKFMLEFNKLFYFLTKHHTLQKYKLVLKEINNFQIPHFKYDGNFLLSKGFSEGKNLGELIKKIEKAWVDNNFHLSDLEVQNLLEKKN